MGKHFNPLQDRVMVIPLGRGGPTLLSICDFLNLILIYRFAFALEDSPVGESSIRTRD